MAQQSPTYLEKPSHSKGFTLIELMITVAIVAILASVALPSYTQYVVRGRLADGQKILATYALAQEQYFQNNNRYATAADGTTCGVSVSGSAYSSSDFTLSCTATATSSSNTYTAKLTGKTGKTVAGYEYQITDTGARKTNKFKNTDYTTLNCWANSGPSC